MQAVITQLNENLKLLYRQALDADQKLDELHRQGHGKFTALFQAEAGFQVEAKRFKPYVLEVAADVAALAESQEIDQQHLAQTVQKLQQLHNLLASFK
ncbi:prephenate dehydrogenase [Pseudoalteromonas fenneropenaei]|uniref:Prephenate dehydrogenase n=1 Tax=Pseudoalteromonas fenneropenaei TaxID=1737459 RepID=A0ABV7CLW6_9GAMM